MNDIPAESAGKPAHLATDGAFSYTCHRWKLGTTGTVLSGTVRFPAFFPLADGSKADAVVTWTFTPGTRKPERPDHSRHRATRIAAPPLRFQDD